MTSVQERLCSLEAELKSMESRLEKAEIELTYYRRVGVKTGAIGICLLSLGAGATMSADKLKEKLIAILTWVFA